MSKNGSVPMIVRRYGKLLRQRRKEKQLTLREFSHRANITKSKLSYIELGKAVPDLVDMQAIARILGEDMGWSHPPRFLEMKTP